MFFYTNNSAFPMNHNSLLKYVGYVYGTAVTFNLSPLTLGLVLMWEARLAAKEPCTFF